ncbi:Oidioi.mRNA.OKI2018_I69.XSR.g16780.t1.cds [Oikopleura dioica]|uniref:Oidioi.mRNA.OKI2018_I69.XSR.g16780.t1.cds n=1 Tax=Oikopleura dioica TaxID=34765 RepID=A0ABN7SMC8_OIKDI|nr:Oidioi.mRNA.OKI2018_I69.XSR.g16780.t1.cds [Oikopleura dioica]
MERPNYELLKFDGNESDDPERSPTGGVFWKPLNEDGTAARLQHEDFLCRECRNEIDDPVVTSCCDKYVCRKCWTNDLHSPKRDTYHLECPICWSRVSYNPPIHSHWSYSRGTFYPASKFYLKMINARMVRCRDKECKMEMKYEDFDEHWKKSCRRLVRCDFCYTESRVFEDHLCEGKFHAKKEEMKKELQVQEEKNEDLMARLGYY